MVKDFKFLQLYQKKPTFQFEITNEIVRSGTQIWTREYSDAVRKWISDMYFNNTYHISNNHYKCIGGINICCGLMEDPEIVDRISLCPLFRVKVKIFMSDDSWMTADLSYPIDYIIYR